MPMQRIETIDQPRSEAPANRFARIIVRKRPSYAEFAKRCESGHHPLRSVLEEENVFTLGKKHGLKQAAGLTRRGRPGGQARQ
jgi:hypothetical protein